MALMAWIVLLGCIGLTAWSYYDLRRKSRRLAKVQQALQETMQKNRRLEEDHDRKQALGRQNEEKLRGYLQLLDTLINTMSNPVCFKDEQGVFQGCNQVFAKTVLGLTRDRIIGRRSQELADRIPPDLAAAYQRQEMAMFGKNGFHAFEARMQCADGLQRDFLFNLAPIRNPQGEPIGSVTVLSDLTEKNRAAQDRLLKERLEGVLETAGGVCHELNQPLQVLSGHLEMLAAGADVPKAVAEHVARALAQIERMRTITLKLQGITRYESMVYADNTKIIDIHKASRPVDDDGAPQAD